MQRVIEKDKSKYLKESKNYSIHLMESQDSYDKLIDKEMHRIEEIANFKQQRNEKVKKDKLKEIQSYQLKQIARKRVK